jgi:hypothetical protein
MSGKIFQSMQEVHYCRLESQSNIYGLTKFAAAPDENKVLVTSLHGKVMSVAFQRDKTVPVSREVTFTYIPGQLVQVISFKILPERESCYSAGFLKDVFHVFTLANVVCSSCGCGIFIGPLK